jgi:hypothetical protein
MRIVDVYEVRCYKCHRTVEMPANAAAHRCPSCDTKLEIEVAGARENRFMKRPDTPEQILAWLEQFACRVEFQDLGAGVLREKNRVIVQYRESSGGVAAVGGRDLRGPL